MCIRDRDQASTHGLLGHPALTQPIKNILLEEAKRENLTITLENGPDNTLTIHPVTAPLENVSRWLTTAPVSYTHLPYCHQSGYQGRMAIHEMMVVTPELRAAIHENVDEQALERLVRQQHNALIKNGLQKVISGDTSWDEVMRVASATLESEA